MVNRTNQSRTQEVTDKYSGDRLAIKNKDPRFDYSFQRRRDVEEGGGQTHDGWDPVSKANNNGEAWDGPKIIKSKGSPNQFLNQDTILCKREKEVSKYFKQESIDKRNNQINFLNNVSTQAKQKLKELDPNSELKDTSSGMPKEYTQKTGPTQEE